MVIWCQVTAEDGIYIDGGIGFTFIISYQKVESMNLQVGVRGGCGQTSK